MRNRTETQINLVLIRHGATPSNAEGRYLGRTEEDLSAAGKEKLLLNKKMGKYPPASIVFSSPMKRCRQTADLLYDCKDPILIEEWREADFGRFEGKNHLDLNGDAEYQKWIDSNGELPFPDGESREDVMDRCKMGLMKVVDELSVNGLTAKESFIAAVVHGGSMMALLSSFGGGNYFDYQCSNGEGYVCRLTFLEHSQPSLEILRKL
ncbi:histidine phosphatase family protein [Gorillibacterium massiliense]|uniref:histidine phosphatase family protein n=1 Tax=Gorillibacterium massiliense TaxID=1280390 RepID=UPI0004B0EEDB|nr:histidine phosphatase family protein [Gorillibacterium massiliense]